MGKRADFKLGAVTFHPAVDEISGPAGRVHLQPKIMDLAVQMAARIGEVVERDELIDEVWQGYPGAEQSLTNAASKLRQALEKAGGDPGLLQTIPKRGYCLVNPDVMGGAAASITRRRSARIWAMSAGSLVALAVVALMLIRPQFQQEDSIAILAFEDLSQAGDQRHFAFGLPEQLTGLLSRIPDLRVIARTSAFALSDSEATIPEIADKLDVNHIVEGSVQTSNNRIRVNVQLIDARRDRHLWAQSYDSRLQDIFELQDRIAANIITAIGKHLDRDAIIRSQPIAQGLYSKYLRALYFSHQGKTSARDAAITLVEEVLAGAPDYVPALNLLTKLAYRAGDYKRSEQALQTALQIEPGNALANAYMGWNVFQQHRDAAQAAKYMRDALDRNPHDPEVLMTAARFARAIGEIDLAVQWSQQATARDPFCGPCIYQLAQAYLYNRQLKKAEQTIKRYQQTGSGGWILLGNIRLLDGRPREALMAYEQQLPPRGHEAYWLASRAMALHDLGREREFRETFDSLRQQWRDREPRSLAYVHAWVGNVEQAITLLYSDLDSYFDSLRKNPYLYRLQSDPRWEELLNNAGVSDTIVSGLLASNWPVH